MSFRQVDVGFPHLTDPRDYVRLAVRAEGLGFDGFWLQEGSGWGAIALAATVLAATKRIRVGTGVISPFKRHPEALAGDAAALAAMSGGRFILGLGSATSAIESFGLAIPQRAGMREAVEIIRRLLRGERFTYAGRVFTYRTPRPLGAPLAEALPIALGGLGPRMIRLAAEVADELLISRRGGSSPRYVEHVTRLVAEVRGPRDRDRAFRVRCFFETALDTDRARALATMRRVFATYTLPTIPRGVLDLTGVGWHEVEPILGALGRAERDAEARISESVMERLAIVGSPDEVLPKLRLFAELGVDAPILYLHGSDPARMLELAGQLLPGLRGA
jgi:5,10-methylenetetrahydromethanopterin reductase